MKKFPANVVLALDIRHHRFGFAVLDGPHDLMDWGILNFRSGVNAVKAPVGGRLESLLDRCSPDVVIIKETKTQEGKRLSGLVHRLAQSRHITTRTITRNSIYKVFADRRNKYEVATVIADRFPELRPRLGRKRKCWEPEQYVMPLFDATALAVTYFVLNIMRAPSSLPR